MADAGILPPTLQQSVLLSSIYCCDHPTISQWVYQVIIQIVKIGVLISHGKMSSGYNFAYVTIAQSSWHAQTCDLAGAF